MSRTDGTLECIVCGALMIRVQCKAMCPNCGYQEDCDDLFRANAPQRASPGLSGAHHAIPEGYLFATGPSPPVPASKQRRRTTPRCFPPPTGGLFDN